MDLILSVRVYGVLINDQKEVLVSDEYIRGEYYTKFPGGGLEIGEGTRECLQREFKEEMNLEVAIGDHIYTTDFFQRSAFRDHDQLISIYYRVLPLDKPATTIATRPFDYGAEKDGALSFRWIMKEQFNEDLLTFPIDKIVAKMIREQYL